MSGGARVHLGTSSWSEKGWVGPFYPPGSKPGDFLSLYARRYDTVEADVTYYRVPDRRLVEGWRFKLPDGFELAAKFPRGVVHGGDGPAPDGAKVLLSPTAVDEAARFLEAMALLGPMCGPLLLQFPYFNRSAFTRVEPFLERLDAFFDRVDPAVRLAVEVRNKAWIAPPLLDLLRRRGAALALVDLNYLPHPDELAQQLGGLDRLLTADFTYVRLIGDRKATDALTKTFDHIVLDQSERLDRWASVIRALSSRLEHIYVFANNHFAGHGPATVEDLKARLAAHDGA